MPSHLEALQKRKNTPISLAHKIALYTSTSNEEAVVVESGDDLYFYSAIAAKLEIRSRFQFFKGERRQFVIDTIKALQIIGKQSKCSAIIDRDFNFDDPEIIHDCILVIDVYSFENFFGEEQTLVDIGRAFFALEPGEDMETWTRHVRNFLSSLVPTFTPEHAIALMCIRNGIRCVMSNLSYDDIVEVQPNGSMARKDGAHDIFIRKCNIDINALNLDEIQDYVTEIESLNWQRSIRGHYFWDCFVKFLNKFRIILDEKLRASQLSRARTRAELTSRHILEAATSHLRTPEVVGRFLGERALAAN